MYFNLKDVLIEIGPSISIVAKYQGLTVSILVGAIKRGSLYSQIIVINTPLILNTTTILISADNVKSMIINAKDKRYETTLFIILPFAVPVIATDTETGK